MKKKYPTLQEAFMSEISKDVSQKYISKVKLKNNKKLYKQLLKITNAISNLYRRDFTPTEAAEFLKTFISLNPDINPLKNFDTLGVKMFIHGKEKDREEVGKEKRYYEEVIQAYIKNYL